MSGKNLFLVCLGLFLGVLVLVPVNAVSNTESERGSVNSSYTSEMQNFSNNETNEKLILRSKNVQTNSSVDELPEIVTFPKRQQNKQPKKVFKNIINNI